MPKRLTTEEFIIKSKIVHGGRYDYSAVNYKNNSTDVMIWCYSHGLFSQSPANHMKGSGCPKCKSASCVTRLTCTSESFIKKAKSVHGDVYDYSRVNYVNHKIKVCIICRKHGSFMQRPLNHLAGFNGCSQCINESLSNDMTLSNDCFISKCISIHGDKYLYDKTEYTGCFNHVVITCKTHGDFSQVANVHTNGSGCPSCAKTGFDKEKDSFVYFLMGDSVIKVGITNRLKGRMIELKCGTPFSFRMIKCIKTSGDLAITIEKYYHKKYESAGLTGFDGATEWLRYSPELMNEIMGL